MQRHSFRQRYARGGIRTIRSATEAFPGGEEEIVRIQAERFLEEKCVHIKVDWE